MDIGHIAIGGYDIELVYSGEKLVTKLKSRREKLWTFDIFVMCMCVQCSF